MECLEGETLRAPLATLAMSIDEVVALAIDVADAPVFQLAARDHEWPHVNAN